ncbi:hypothetical protein [Sphingomonas sp. SRS2]|uniref:hypothetical protein n=1 Tax=Sphingomonas sp. SRS2 TaxID=133190 RepID=UPI00061843CE|nr:hypothetical protein [Sphingomonas sp. SRS2]KKC27496.1 hypothetical protein WP12_02760 [Sphingomonas sp. SRS2]
MSADSVCRSLRRRLLLSSLRATRTSFARSGDFVRAAKIELGIQMLLDQQVSDRMLSLLDESAAIAARDAADLVAAGRG